MIITKKIKNLNAIYEIKSKTQVILIIFQMKYVDIKITTCYIMIVINGNNLRELTC